MGGSTGGQHRRRAVCPGVCDLGELISLGFGSEMLMGVPARHSWWVGCRAGWGAAVDTVMRYQVGDGSSVLVEVDEDTYGVEEVARISEGVLKAGQTLEAALGSVRDAAKAALDALAKLSPETLEVEFGIKLAGEALALIAKTSAEGHFTVRMSWSPGDNDKSP